MANFIGLVFATLKNEGVDTSKLSTDEAIKKYNELKSKGSTKQKKEVGLDDNESDLNKQIKSEFKQDIEEFLKDEDIKVVASSWDKDFLVIKTTDNNKVFNQIRRNYLYNDTFAKNGSIYIKVEQDDQSKGTSAEQKRMKQPKSEHINHELFDKAEKYYTSVEGRDKKSIQAFKDVREQINEMANAGKNYDDIDTQLTHQFSTLEYNTNKLMDKKEKTQQEKQQIHDNMRMLEGMSFAISQLWKVWKK